MDPEKMAKLEQIPKKPHFLARHKAVFIMAGGFFMLHLAWWRLVEAYVPEEERPKGFAILGKLDPFRSKAEATKE